MDWLTIKKYITEAEPFLTISFGFLSFATGFIGGMLKQRYKEGAIKGEIDTKFANCGRKITNIDNRIEDKILPRISAVEAKVESYYGSFENCKNLQVERMNTQNASILLLMQDLVHKEFQKLDDRMAILREKAKAEKQAELESLKAYVDAKFQAILIKKPESK